MADFDNYISGLLDQVKGLFGQQQKFNQPSSVSVPARPADNRIISPGTYTAPLHGTWHSSGGFTYQPNPTHPQGHMGIDLRASGGTPVYPLTSGIVSNVGTDPKGGNVVNINHAHDIRSYYAHLSTVSVHKGDKVDTNTIIGTVGNSGNASHTFPHLHFQVWVNGQITDPARFFSVPPYSNLSLEEKRRGLWLSDNAKQEAMNFSMKKHLLNRRAAFSEEINKLVTLSSFYEKCCKRS